ncbi:MAG: hydrogenase maturation nickel metallochaperone HypA [Methylococcales bacterium]|jgi:hydrogenase nickel incorporation protein HypA/HybF
MHELSLCDDLLNQVIAIAQQNNAQSIESVTVTIGALAGIEPILLENAFSIIKINTVAEFAQLIIRKVPVTVLCLQCGAKSEVLLNHLLCHVCKSHDTSLISGDELVLASVAFFV